MTTIVINGFKIDDSTVFQYKQNPKRSGSKAHARYELYQAATTLIEYDDICKEADIVKYGKADLRYDTEKLHLLLLDADGKMMNAPEAQADADDAAATEEESTDEVEEVDTVEPSEIEDDIDDEGMEEVDELIEVDEAEAEELEATLIDDTFDEDSELESEEFDSNGPGTDEVYMDKDDNLI